MLPRTTGYNPQTSTATNMTAPEFKGCGMNSVLNTSDQITWSKFSEKLKTTSWVVLMHSPGVGTFAPSFSSIDEAEEFSNAMRICCADDTAISEPIPVVKTKTIKVNETSKPFQ